MMLSNQMSRCTNKCISAPFHCKALCWTLCWSLTALISISLLLHLQVKKVKHGKHTKITLTVDLQMGKYSVIKPAGKETLDQNTVPHDESKL